jgi:Uma2 family endonuclease
MVQSLPKPLTLEEFLVLPETQPASEYIDGQIIQKPMPQGKHSTIQTEFSTTVNTVLKARKIGRAFSELRCTFGGRSTVPDVAVFTQARIPRDRNGEIANVFPTAPDWTVESLSPEQSQTKVTKNILHCLNHGTQMGWLIDPDEQTLFVYRPHQQPEVIDELDQPLPAPAFAQDLSLTLATIFTWLLD